MPITFNTQEEAKEYMQNQLDKRIQTYKIKSNGKYIVHTLGKITKKAIPIKKMDTPLPGEYAEYRVNEQGKKEIRLSNKATKRIIEHELGHACLGHTAGLTMKPKTDARDEIDAEIYSFTKMKRDIDYKVGVHAIHLLTLPEYGFNLSRKDSVSIVKNLLKEKGIELPPTIEKQWVERTLPEYLV